MNAQSLAPFPSNPCLCRSELSKGLKNLGMARGRGKQNRFTFASLRELFEPFYGRKVARLGVPPLSPRIVPRYRSRFRRGSRNSRRCIAIPERDVNNGAKGATTLALRSEIAIHLCVCNRPHTGTIAKPKQEGATVFAR